MLTGTRLRIAIVTLLIVAALAGLFAFIFRDRVYYRSPLLLISQPRFTFVLGEVRFRASAEADWETAAVGKLLNSGYEIETAANSVADIRFQSRTALRVREDSRLVLNEATIRGISVRLERGQAWGQFKKLFQEQRIGVSTPTATTYVRGTELGFEMLEVPLEVPPQEQADAAESEQTETATRVYALSGIVEVFNPRFVNQKSILSYQNSAIVPRSGPPREPTTLSGEEVERILRILNSIHYEDVLLITTRLRFAFASAELLPESAAELDDIAKVLKENDERVRIDGHTDNIGSVAANYRLSLERARSIRRELAARGVPAERLLIGGHGENKPVASNETEAGRAENRRVEFLIVE
jgi:outer membrane protein OmpA-like peptidoglycan-associated protein